MESSVRRILVLALFLAPLLLPGARVLAQADPLSAARAAYLATEYEDALTILTDAHLSSDESDVYRALCLLALGRMTDLDRVLQNLVVRNPSFHMSDRDVTPRMISLFEDVRSRTLLAMVHDNYAAAKASFDAGRFSDASRQFADLLAMIAREDATLAREGSGAGDVRQLARGFKDLADAQVAKTTAAPAIVPAPAAAEGSLARVSTPVVVPDKTAIEGVVARYALAYSSLDAGAVARVYPAENPEILRSVFGRLKSQSIDARNLSVVVDPDGRAATATLTWVVQAVPKVGSTVKAQHPTTLRLARTAAGEWMIVERR